MEQVTGTKAPLASGQSITASVGDELIILTCVRPGYAYTVSPPTRTPPRKTPARGPAP